MQRSGQISVIFRKMDVRRNMEERGAKESSLDSGLLHWLAILTEKKMEHYKIMKG